jgi:hypothetical protein
MVSKIKVDEIEASQGSNITFNHTPKVDTISEKTSGSGVTIDSVLLKDGKVAASAGGGLVLINSTNASTATDVTFDNVFTSTYQSYKIIINNYNPSTTSDLRLIFRNGGASGADITGKHDSRYWYIASSSGWTQGTASTNANYVVLSNGTVSGGDYGFNIELWNPQLSSAATTGFMTGTWDNGGQLQTGMSLDSREEVTGVKLVTSTGTISGDIYLYGYSKT